LADMADRKLVMKDGLITSITEMKNKHI